MWDGWGILSECGAADNLYTTEVTKFVSDLFHMLNSRDLKQRNATVLLSLL